MNSATLYEVRHMDTVLHQLTTLYEVRHVDTVLHQLTTQSILIVCVV